MIPWPTPLLFGHRGASRLLPENTRAAFERALHDGATALETDVRMTRDGILVCMHDATLLRTAGSPLEVARSTFAELSRASAARAPLLTLDALLDIAGPVFVNMDIKQTTPRIEERVVRAVEDRGAFARVLLTSFHPRVIGRLRRLGYRGPTGASAREIAQLLFLRGALSRALPLGAARVQVPRRWRGVVLDSPAFIARCHAAGVAVDYWVVNDAAAAQDLLARGADGVMSDDPRAVVSAFAVPTADSAVSALTDRGRAASL